MGSLRMDVVIGLTVLLVLGVDSQGDGGARGRSGAAGASRLVYTFTSGNPQGWQRAARLQQIVWEEALGLEMVGVVLDLQDAAGRPEVLEAARVHGITFRVVGPSAAAALGVAPQLLEGPGVDGRVILLGPSARAAVLGSGREAEEALRDRRRVSTDVNESTWGKIKELFQ
ncbi:MAG: hypothetical protein AB1505_16815 [Candidatus Latescibacterota bacterium]